MDDIMLILNEVVEIVLEAIEAKEEPFILISKV